MRRWGGMLAWAWLAACALALVLRWVDLTGPIPSVQALLPLAGLALIVLVAVSAIARQWVVAFCAGLLIIPYAVLALPWFVPGGADESDRDVVVMAANVYQGGADLALLDATVADLGVEVLVLVEVTPQYAEQIEADGSFAGLEHRSGTPRTDAGGTMVFTASAHEVVAGPQGIGFDQVAIRLQRESSEWMVLGAHTYPPLGMQSDRWRADLRRVESWVAAQPDSVPLIVAGDLNSSQAHPGFRSATAGLESAHRQVGAGWVRTWPAEGWIPRFVQVDHVLTRDLIVVDAGDVDLGGSDHRAVWSRLRSTDLG